MRTYFYPNAVSVILIAVCAILVACNAQPPTLPTAFTSGFDDWGQWTQTSSRQAAIEVKDNQLHITLKQPDTLAWSAAGLVLKDFTLEVDATPLEGPDDNGYGLIARRVDDENFYSFLISGDGYFIVQKRAKGQWSKLSGDWQASPAIHTGRRANRLRVTCQGKTLTFVVNDTQLAQITDNAFAQGDIGVIASTFAEPGARIAFDNVRLTEAR